MIANRTTLILGAGASAPTYPVGSELVEKICGYYVNGTRDERLAIRLRNSMLPSIDTFLAELGNQDLIEHGKERIAEILLPCEVKEPPRWYQLLFNAIRYPGSPRHQHKLQVVTFNYDLSLEFSIWRAFSATYKVSGDEAKTMMDESLEIIHVYGDLGKIATPQGDRIYGDLKEADIASAAQGIEIIGRKPDDPRFHKAQEAIRSADFLGILGFGFDETNIANLKLTETASKKAIFSTGYNMGYGTRAWLRHIGLPKIMIAPPSQSVEVFLTKSGFFHWANVPDVNGYEMHGAIISEITASKFHLPNE